jgi:hypothetical protein
MSTNMFPVTPVMSALFPLQDQEQRAAPPMHLSTFPVTSGNIRSSGNEKAILEQRCAHCSHCSHFNRCVCREAYRTRSQGVLRTNWAHWEHHVGTGVLSARETLKTSLKAQPTACSSAAPSADRARNSTRAGACGDRVMTRGAGQPTNPLRGRALRSCERQPDELSARSRSSAPPRPSIARTTHTPRWGAGKWRSQFPAPGCLTPLTSKHGGVLKFLSKFLSRSLPTTRATLSRALPFKVGEIPRHFLPRPSLTFCRSFAASRSMGSMASAMSAASVSVKSRIATSKPSDLGRPKRSRDATVSQIRKRAERRAGQLLDQMAKRKERAGRGGNRKSKSHDATLKLPDLGVTKTESSRWQKLASMPAPERRP